MTMMTTYALVAGGGALGAMARFTVAGQWLSGMQLFGLPLGILGINWLGSALMGVLIGYMAYVGTQHTHALHLLLATGFLGGFTTFSSFALEVVTLLEQNASMQAVSYALLSVVGSVLLLVAGLWLTRMVLHG